MYMHMCRFGCMYNEAKHTGKRSMNQPAIEQNHHDLRLKQWPPILVCLFTFLTPYQFYISNQA